MDSYILHIISSDLDTVKRLNAVFMTVKIKVHIYTLDPEEKPLDHSAHSI